MTKTPETKYTRLPGKGLRRQGFFAVVRTYCTLWLANDHILNVDNRVFSEDYKRFYFRDIQAIITQRTNRGKVWNLILITLIGLFVLIAFGSEETVTMVSWLIVAGIFGIFLLINWLRGPTCTCQIVTAVQQDTLPSLDRLKKAEKVTKILKRFIQEAQGEFNAEEAQTTQATELSNQPNASGSSFYFTSQARSDQSVQHYHGRMHGVVFSLLLADGILTCLHLLLQNVVLSLVNLGLTLVFSICLIIALVKQYNTDITKGIRWVTWSSFAYVCVSYVIGYILSVYLVFLIESPIQRGTDQWEFYKTVAELSPYDYPLLLSIDIFFMLYAFLLGGLGFIFLRRFRQEYKIPPPPEHS